MSENIPSQSDMAELGTIFVRCVATTVFGY